MDKPAQERTAVAVITTEPRMQLVYRPRWKTDHHPWVFFDTAGEELFRFSHGEVEEA